MTQQSINLGQADKGNGDPLRTAFDKVNDNFTELYSSVIASGVASTSASPPVAAGAGDLWWNTNDGNLYVYYLGTWTSANAGSQGPQGAVGPQGAEGPAGIRGLKGNTGDIGPRGYTGETGAQGSVGPRGVKGDKGDTGEAGPAGTNGADGAQGPQGIRGLKGDTGEAGPQGLKGDTGLTGAQGPQGIRGLKGDKGDTGLRGLTGNTGAPGPQGDRGFPGTQVQFSLTAPDPIVEGNVWWNMNDGNLYVYYNSQWVSAVSIAAPEVNTGNIEFRNDSMNDVNGILITNASQTIQPTVSITIPANDSGAPLSINNDDKTWTFGTDGTLTFPAPNGTGATFTHVNLTGIDVLHSVNNLNLESDKALNLITGLDIAGLHDIYLGAEYTWEDIRNQDAQLIAPATRPWDGMPSYEAYPVLMNYNSEPPGGGVLPPNPNMAPVAKTASDAWQAYQAALNASIVNIEVGDYLWQFKPDGELTVPGAIRKNGSLYLNSGGEGTSSSVVVQGDNGRVFIRTIDGLTQNEWYFKEDGNLTLPGSNTIESTQGSISFVNGSNSSLLTIAADVQIRSTNVFVGGDPHFWGFTAAGATNFPSGAGFVKGDSGQLKTNDGTTLSLDFRDSSGRGFYTNGDGFSLRGNGSNTWTFGTNGSLTLPGGSAIGYTPSVSTDITVNNKKWAFDVNGTLTVPGNISAEVGKNLSIKTKSVTDIAIEFAGSGYPSLGGLFATTGGSGTGMTVQVYGPSGSLEAVSIGNPGSGYLDGDVVNVVGGNGTVRVRITQGNWTFGTDGGLTFLDTTVQTTAYPGITNTHENSNTIAVGDNIAVRDHLAVRVTNNNDTLDVEIKYSNPDVQAVISVFTMYPVAANLYTGRTIKSANNTTWDLVGNFPMAGDSLGFTLTDHSFFKIYKVTLVAHMMPGVGASGEALCGIEELK